MDPSTVRTQCIALIKSHKLKVSSQGAVHIAAAACSRDPTPLLPDNFPDDYVKQVLNTLSEELEKVPAVEYIDVSVFTSNFVRKHSLSLGLRDKIMGHIKSFFRSKK